MTWSPGKCLIALCCAAAATAAAAQAAPEDAAPAPRAAEPLSLAQAVQTALERHPAIAGNRLGRIVDRFEWRAARRQFVPLFELNGSTQRQSDGAGNTGTATSAGTAVRWALPTGAQITYAWSANQLSGGTLQGGGHGNSASFSLRQPLLKGAGTRVATAPLQLAQWQEEISRLRRDAVVSAAITEVVGAYRGLQRAQRARAIAERGVARARELIAINQELVRAGRLAAGELLQTEADLALQEQGLAQARLAELSAQLALSGLLLLGPEQAFDPVEPLAAAPHPALTAAQAVALAVERQPDYQQALLAERQAELQREVARNARLPDVALTLSNATVTGTGLGGGARATVAGLAWAIPLNDLSTERPQVGAGVALEQARLASRVALEQLQHAVQLALHNLELLARQRQLARDRLELSRRKLALEREKLKAGRSTNFQVVAYQDDLRQAELSDLDATIDHLNALTNLDRLLGLTLQTWQVSLDD